MIKLVKLILLFILILSLHLGCSRIVDNNESDIHAFETFWEVMDKNYVYFELKELDWDDIYKQYWPLFQQSSNYEETSALFQEIITTINDDHVSLRYKNNDAITTWSDTSIINMHFDLMQLRYDFSNVKLEAAVTFSQLPGDVSYIRLSTDFNGNIEFEKILTNYSMRNGLIIDLRDCRGGYSEAIDFCRLFHNDKVTLYYKQFKNGVDHDCFTDLYPVSSNGNQFIPKEIPIVVLINRNTYSLGNTIASVFDNVRVSKLIGEKTGGGGGSVHAVHLTGGWTLNYTFSRNLSAAKKFIEEGIQPNITVAPPYDFWQDEHWETGEDPQLEKAIDVLQ